MSGGADGGLRNGAPHHGAAGGVGAEPASLDEVRPDEAGPDEAGPEAGTQARAGRDGGPDRHRLLVVRRAVAEPAAAVLVLHGGRDHGMRRPSPLLNAPAWRMRPFVTSLARATAGRRVLLAEVRYRHTGWNGDRADAAHDAAEALAELSRRTGGAPVVLLGHSMGGRAALRAADGPGVTGVVGLAPWCPPDEPVGAAAGARLVFAHAEADRITSPAGSLAAARRARAAGAEVCRFTLSGGDHAMLRQAGLWHALTTRIVCGLLGLTPLPPEVAAAFALPAGSPDGLALPAAATLAGTA